MFFKVLIVLLCLLSLSLAEIAVEDCAPSYNPWGYTMARTKARNDKKPAF